MHQRFNHLGIRHIVRSCCYVIPVALLNKELRRQYCDSRYTIVRSLDVVYLTNSRPNSFFVHVRIQYREYSCRHVDLIRRSWVRFPPRSKDFFFAPCGSLIPFTRAKVQWVIHGFNQHLNLHFRVNSLFHH